MSENKISYPNIQVSKGMAGWFALKVWWNPAGFPEPDSTGAGRYALQSDAIDEAKEWAGSERLPFIMPVIDNSPARQDVAQQIKERIPDVQIHNLTNEYSRLSPATAGGGEG